MLLEPGYYEDGKFGIRIESKSCLTALTQRILTEPFIDIVMAREVNTPHKFGDKQWLGFEHVTMTPIGRNLIKPPLLTDFELKWVNDYHAEVWDKTHHYFTEDELSRKWLERETQPISK
jgi:Xaa-Pro aminopeptidase